MKRATKDMAICLTSAGCLTVGIVALIAWLCPPLLPLGSVAGYFVGHATVKVYSRLEDRRLRRLLRS